MASGVDVTERSGDGSDNAAWFGETSQSTLALSRGADLDDGAGRWEVKLMEEPFVWGFLRKVQTYELPSPEILLEEDGDLGFDWLDASRSVSVSLSQTGRISWAALVGDYKAHGRFQWPDWSPELDRAFVLFNG